MYQVFIYCLSPQPHWQGAVYAMEGSTGELRSQKLELRGSQHLEGSPRVALLMD